MQQKKVHRGLEAAPKSCYLDAVKHSNIEY